MEHQEEIQKKLEKLAQLGSEGTYEEIIDALEISPEREKRYRKEFQELHISDSFMFAELISYPHLAQGLLETILEKKIEKVEVRTEESIEVKYLHKEVRLDAYIKGSGEVYNIEMQVSKQFLAKRIRSYEGKMDLDHEKRGANYDDLPDTYVIFICLFDPYDQEYSRYDFTKICQQNLSLTMGDGRHTILLNAKQWKKESNPELKAFLRYVAEKTVEGELASQFNEAMNDVKTEQRIGVKFMTLEAIFYERDKVSRQEGIEKGIEKGREKGREEGREEERAKAQAERIKQAKLMLLDMDNEKIAKYTGFTVEQIQKWRESETPTRDTE